MALTQQTKTQIITLRAEGQSYAKIAELVKVSKQTAIDVAREAQDAIATLQATEMEALYEAHRINQRGRLEQLSELQRKLLEEIQRRDLTDVPTKDLFNLFLSTSKSIKEEVTAPRYSPPPSKQTQPDRGQCGTFNLKTDGQREVRKDDLRSKAKGR